MAQSLFITLKQRNPDTCIDVLAPGWSRPILKRMPEVSGAIDMPVGRGRLELSERRAIGRRLKPANYNQAIVLPNSLKSALIPWFAGIPRRTGWKGEMRYGLLNDIRSLDKQRYPLMVERFNALAYPANTELPAKQPAPALLSNPDSQAGVKVRLGLSTKKKVLALCPGAEFGPAKQWPADYYAAVAADKLTDGWQAWLLGSPSDQAVTRDILEHLPEVHRGSCHDLAGKTRLEDALDLLAAADAVVSNDSGLMHIAAALGRPLVAVYGSTSPGFTPPLGGRVRSLSIPVDCGPCFQRTCPQGHLKCLRELRPQSVLAALRDLRQDMQRDA